MGARGFSPTLHYAQLVLKVSDAALEGLVTSVCSGTDGFTERTGEVLMARIFVWMKQKMSLVTLPRAETRHSTAHTCFSLFCIFYFYLDFLLSPFPLNASAVPNHPTTFSPFPSPTWPP